MKQYLHVRPDGQGAWCVSGENLSFYISCSDREAALFVAHQTRNQWYPRARVKCQEPRDEEAREARFQRLEWRDQMRSDWNE